MDLERKLVARVEDFAEQRKAVFAGRLGVAEQFVRVLFHEPAQIFSGERAVGDDAGVAGAIALTMFSASNGGWSAAAPRGGKS